MELEFYNKDFTYPPKGKKPKKLYLICDVETATLPIINNYNIDDKRRKDISIAKPLIYDFAWQIVSSTGYVYSRHNYLIQETFFVPAVFNTAYYKNKRPLYIEKLEREQIQVANWNDAMRIFINDLKQSNICLAYNSMFDFKKAIPFTEQYIRALYSNNFIDYEREQKKSIERILNGQKSKDKNFDPDYLWIRNQKYLQADIWGLACQILLNNDAYRKQCIRNGNISDSGLYFKTSAEQAQRYLLKDLNFNEAHLALEDTIIETEIFLKLLKKLECVPCGIEYFPFKELGTVPDYCMTTTPKGKPVFSKGELLTIADILYSKLKEYQPQTPFYNRLSNALEMVVNFILRHYKSTIDVLPYLQDCNALKSKIGGVSVE